MDEENVSLGRGDAAVILHANGDVGLLLPKSAADNGDAEPARNVALAMAFAIISQHEVLGHIAMTMAEAAADQDSESDDEPEEAAA